MIVRMANKKETEAKEAEEKRLKAGLEKIKQETLAKGVSWYTSKIDEDGNHIQIITNPDGTIEERIVED